MVTLAYPTGRVALADMKAGLDHQCRMGLRADLRAAYTVWSCTAVRWDSGCVEKMQTHHAFDLCLLLAAEHRALLPDLLLDTLKLMSELQQLLLFHARAVITEFLQEVSDASLHILPQLPAPHTDSVELGGCVTDDPGACQRLSGSSPLTPRSHNMYSRVESCENSLEGSIQAATLPATQMHGSAMVATEIVCILAGTRLLSR